MASKKSPSIFGTLQKTTEAASAVNGEFVRQLRVSDLEDNPMNRFSMAEDEQFLSTVESVKKDGFLEDIIVTPAAAEGKYRIVSGHRRVAAARKLGKTTVPCKVRHYEDSLAELRALMGANLHRRNLSPFDMARQLETLREVLKNEDKLPANIKEQSELMAEQTDLSRATVERYLDLLNLDETLTAWAEGGKMTMTDAYELARRSNAHLYPAVEEFVAKAGETDDFPVLVHRAIAYAKAAELPPAPPKAAPNALRSVDSFGRAIRRSTAQLCTLKLDDADKATAKRKLDTARSKPSKTALTDPIRTKKAASTACSLFLCSSLRDLAPRELQRAPVQGLCAVERQRRAGYRHRGIDARPAARAVLSRPVGKAVLALPAGKPRRVRLTDEQPRIDPLPRFAQQRLARLACLQHRADRLNFHHALRQSHAVTSVSVTVPGTPISRSPSAKLVPAPPSVKAVTSATPSRSSRMALTRA